MTGSTPFEQFFAFRRFQPAAELTPDGESVLFVSNISGQFNLWSTRVDGGWPDQLTTFTENTVRAVTVRRDGTILFIADRDGDEFHQLYRIPAGGGWPEQLTDLPQVQHSIGPGAWSPDGASFAFAANSRRPEDSEVFVWRDGDVEPRFAANAAEGGGYILEIENPAPIFREAQPGDFVSVSTYAANRPAALPFATRLQFKFAQLRAGEKLTTGLIQLAPGADFRQARYRILNMEGGSSWKILE